MSSITVNSLDGMAPFKGQLVAISPACNVINGRKVSPTSEMIGHVDATTSCVGNRPALFFRQLTVYQEPAPLIVFNDENLRGFNLNVRVLASKELPYVIQAIKLRESFIA